MRTLLLLGLLSSGTSFASPGPQKPASAMIECRNDKLPHFRLELEAPPPAGLHAGTYNRRIRFWDDKQLVGDDVIRLVTSRHLTRVEVGDEIAATGQHGFELALLDVQYTSNPKIKQLGFTGEIRVMGARASLTCRRVP